MNHNPHMLDVAKKMLRRRQVLRDFQIMHPRRDWFIGVGIATVLFMVGATFSVHTYLTNIEVSQTSSEATEEVVVYRESVVKAALERLQERETVFISVLGSPSIQVPASVVATTSAPIGTTETPLEIEEGSEVNQATTSVESEIAVPAPL